jgi:hypothetical protein
MTLKVRCLLCVALAIVLGSLPKSASADVMAGGQGTADKAVDGHFEHGPRVFQQTAGSSAHGGESDASAAIGEQLYRRGSASNVASLRAAGPGGLPLEASAAACVRCHRRSGFGGFEGGRAVPPITARDLFCEESACLGENLLVQVSSHRVRPAYTQQGLYDALTRGVDSAGRALDALMPRFSLDEAQFAALYAYLRGLGMAPTPGVSDTTLHLATVVDDTVPLPARDAMLRMVENYVQDKNSQTRADARRAQQARRIREPMYARYRRWELHVWTLQGDQGAWSDQLEGYYRNQPVFAVLGGIASAEWYPVHAFCERQQLPCLFPLTEQPPAGSDDFYSVYLSAGATLDGRLAAAYLGDITEGTILSVYRTDTPARLAAQSLRRALLQSPKTTVAQIALAPAATFGTEQWRAALREHAPTALVIWLDETQWPDFAALASDTASTLRVVVTTRRHELHPLGASLRGAPHAVVLYPYALPLERADNLRRMRAWLHRKHIEASDEIIQANTFFTLTLAGDALKHATADFSRDYFVERIEEMTENAAIASAYPRLGLGPNQRYASKGGYLIPVDTARGTLLLQSAQWIVP